MQLCTDNQISHVSNWLRLDLARAKWAYTIIRRAVVLTQSGRSIVLASSSYGSLIELLDYRAAVSSQCNVIPFPVAEDLRACRAELV